MCEAVLKAVAVIRKSVDEILLLGVDREDMCEDDDVEEVTDEGYNDFYYEGIVDSVTGEGLEPTQVKAGCDEELKFMKSMKVWDRVLRSGVRDKIVGSRWVYAKKPNLVRCRLVAQEFDVYKPGGDSMQERSLYVENHKLPAASRSSPSSGYRVREEVPRCCHGRGSCVQVFPFLAPSELLGHQPAPYKVGLLGVNPPGPYDLVTHF